MAGDLFVHLFSGTHFITGSHGPTRGMATGGLRFWKDGRDVPDVMLGLFDYRGGIQPEPAREFCRRRRGERGLIFTGSEGTMEIAGNSREREPRAAREGAGLTIGTFTDAMQKQITEDVPAEISAGRIRGPATRSDTRSMSRRADYSDSYDHFKNFFASVRVAAAGGRRCGLRLSAPPALRC